MGSAYEDKLDDLGYVRLRVRFDTHRREVTDYALVLLVEHGGRLETVRVYDSAHGHNEMHRYTKKLGKRPAEIFHGATLGEGMRAALEEIKRSYGEMIVAWRRG